MTKEEIKRKIDQLQSHIYSCLIVHGKADDSVSVQLRELKQKLIDIELTKPTID